MEARRKAQHLSAERKELPIRILHPVKIPFRNEGDGRQLE